MNPSTKFRNSSSEGNSGHSSDFPGTRWSIIADLRNGNEEKRAKAKEKIAAIYRQPVYQCARSLRNCSPDDAENLTQDFFLNHVVWKDSLAGADEKRGRLRNYIKLLLRSLWKDWLKHENAKKRGGEAQKVDVELADSESSEPFPEALLDREWAKALLAHVEKVLRARAPDRKRFNAFWPFWAGGLDNPTRAKIAADLGMSEGAVATACSKLRGSFGQMLRAELAETVERPEDIEDEIRYFLKCIAE